MPTRFWSKVSIDGVTGCWPWTASLNAAGYGAYWLDGQMARGHRALFLAIGGEADGLDLDHLCRNRACVNPRHLEPVSHAENIARGTWGLVTAQRRSALKCKHGHALVGKNLWQSRKGGQRKCRTCMNRMQREYRARVRAATTRQELP